MYSPLPRGAEGDAASEGWEGVDEEGGGGRECYGSYSVDEMLR